MSTSFDPRRQRGDMLLESLIGVLLLSALGAGMANVAGRVLNAQHETRIADLAVVEMRRMLQEEGEGLCTAPTPREVVLGGAADGVPVDVRIECGAPPVVSVAAAGAGTINVFAPPVITLRVDPEELGLDADGPDLIVGSSQ